MEGTRVRTGLAFTAALGLAVVAGAAEPSWDEMKVATLPADHPPHWVWVDDISFFHMMDGRAYLVDADSGRFLGQVSPGGYFAHLNLPKTRKEFYATATFYSRTTRGERTDAVIIYDPSTLGVIGEVVIPPKKHSGMPFLAYQALTDDERFLAVFNMTPAQSVTIVDLEKRSVATEHDTPGCALVYPNGLRRFHLLCGNGALRVVQLGADGSVEKSEATAGFFDPREDPITEKGVRVGSRWYYVSFSGNVHTADLAKATPRYEKPWSLLGDADRSEQWLPGGIQHLAAHAGRGELYSLMHQGGADTHKDPGTEVWVYDLKTKKRLRRIALAGPGMATSIQVTTDDAPLLLATFAANPALEVYDARSGKHLRTIEGLGETPLVIQTR